MDPKEDLPKASNGRSGDHCLVSWLRFLLRCCYMQLGTPIEQPLRVLANSILLHHVEVKIWQPPLHYEPWYVQVLSSWLEGYEG